MPQTDDAALLALAQSFRGGEGQQRFELLFERLAEHVKQMVEDTAGRPEAGRPEPWIAAWDSLSNLPGEAEAVNLDRQDAFWSAMASLKQAARV